MIVGLMAFIGGIATAILVMLVLKIVRKNRDLAKHWVALLDWDGKTAYIGRHKPNQEGQYEIKTGGKAGLYLPQREAMLHSDEGPVAVMHPETGWSFLGEGRRQVEQSKALQWASFWNPFTYMHAHERNDAQDSMNANIEESAWARNAPILAIIGGICVVTIMGMLGFVISKVGGGP